MADADDGFHLTQELGAAMSAHDAEGRLWGAEGDGWRREAEVGDHAGNGGREEAMEDRLAEWEATVAATEEADDSGSSEAWQMASCVAWYDRMQALYPIIYRPDAYTTPEGHDEQKSPTVLAAASHMDTLPTVSTSPSMESRDSPHSRASSGSSRSPPSTSSLVVPRLIAPATPFQRRRLHKKTRVPDWRAPQSTSSPSSFGVRRTIRKNTLTVAGRSKASNIASRDNWIRWMIGSFNVHEIAQEPGLTSWKGLRQVWGGLPESTRLQWCEAVRSGTLDSFARPTLQELQHRERSGEEEQPDNAATEGRRNAEEFCERSSGHRGGMLTWHGRWGADRPDVQEIMDSKRDPDDVAALVRNSEFYQDLWKSFKTFILHLLTKQQWPEISVTMEVTRHRRKAHNVVHFHCAFSDPHKYHKHRPAEFYEFLRSKPHFAGLEARGQRSADRARSRLHYYIMAPKCGSVFEETNFRRGHDYQVHSDSIMNLWRLRKLESEKARDELVLCRVSGVERCLREIEVLEREAARRDLRKEWLRINLEMPKCPFKVIPEVQEWMQGLQDKLYKVGRFPFLVLTGPSQVGKTRYAQALYGVEASLLISCQNVTVPNLRAYDRQRHKAIIYDEGSSKMVVQNKAVFQSNQDTIGLGQSACNQHYYEVLLYGTAQIICCNDWLNDITEDSDKEWLASNSKVVEVWEKLYVESTPDAIRADLE